MNWAQRFDGRYLLALFLLAVAALVEVALAIPIPRRGYLSYAAFTAAMLMLWVRAQWRRAAAPLAMAILGLCVLYLVPWTSRKPFLHKVWQVEPGMTVQSLDALLTGYEQHESALATGTTVRAYHHTRTGRFDSDVALVRIRNGHVVMVEFLPD